MKGNNYLCHAFKIYQNQYRSKNYKFKNKNKKKIVFNIVKHTKNTTIQIRKIDYDVLILVYRKFYI